MPTYDFKCGECGHITDLFLSISLASTPQPCSECGGEMLKTFIPENWNGQMVLRGQWPGKDLKEKRYRKRRSQELAKKQKDNHPIPTLQPNVAGERCESWREAKLLAKECGLDTSSYDDKVSNLHKGNK